MSNFILKVKRRIDRYRALSLFLCSLFFSSSPMMAFATGAGESEAAGTDLSEYLTSGTTVLEWLIESMGTLVGFIMSYPFLSITFFLMIAGAAIGFISRIIHSV